MEDRACPLCKEKRSAAFSRGNDRDYYHCRVCSMVFVPPEHFLSRQEEKKRYDLHRNCTDDTGYLAYLSRLYNPMLERITPKSRGFDFGCGPEPVLASLFGKAGHKVAVYDVFYRPEESVFQEHYDFITASEVVEHLRDPGYELERLWSCLNPGGILGIMTQWIVPAEAFSRWHYRNDRTHICFYAKETFEWLAQKWGATTVFPERDVVLFLKKEQV